MSVAEFCRACRAYAERFVGTMTEQFQRLGILGTWDQPYLTMDFRYQAAIARTFGRFVEKGLVYKGKKPVHWCIHCRTALAEAEVEYLPHHISPSIYVEFPLAPESADELASRVPALAGRDVSVLIWTTTPWTIPSNLAVAFHPEFDYAAYEIDGRAVIVAEALAPTCRGGNRATLRQGRRQDEGGAARVHPLPPSSIPRGIRSACWVPTSRSKRERASCTPRRDMAPTTSSPARSTVSRSTRRSAQPAISSTPSSCSPGSASSMQMPTVEQELKKRSAAAGTDADFSHQYPHCWRCHNPVIFLATSQWFIRMDGEAGDSADDGQPRTLRQAALHAIDNDVKWIPAWGHDRIYNMVSSRPDWCISRQRAWGVPIPAVDCTKCGEAITTPELVEKAATVFEQHGADAWYERPVEEFLPPGLDVPGVRRHHVRERDEHPRRLVRLGIEPRSRALGAARADVAVRHVSRRQRSAPRLVPELAAARARHARPRAVSRGRDPRLPDRHRRPEDVEVARQRRSRRRTSSSRAAPTSCGCGWR